MDFKQLAEKLNSEGLTQEAAIKAIEKTFNATLRTQEQEAEWVENQQKKIKDPLVKEFWDNLDNDLKTLTGEDKNAGEKSHEFLKRAFAGQGDKVKALEAKLAKIEKDGLDKEETYGVLQKNLDQVKKDLKAKSEELDNYKKEVDAGKFRSRVDGEIQGILSELKPKFKQYEDVEMQNHIEATLNRFGNEYTPKDVNGTLMWMDKEGNPVTDHKTGNPVGLKSLLEGKFDFMVDKNKSAAGTAGWQPGGQGGQGGQGGAGGQGGQPDLSQFKIDVSAKGIKTQTDLFNHIKGDLKIDNMKNAEVFNNYMKANKEGLPLQ